MELYTGIDGCRGGWLVCTLDENNLINIELYTALVGVIDVLQKSSVVSIDMPIGLVSSMDEARDCDAIIRKELGKPFSSSVFNVPCYQAVYAQDYTAANRINKEIIGKGLSIQSWNIVSKIKELDILIRKYSELKENLFEGHPELCFKFLKGQTLEYKKKTQEGKKERIQLLETRISDVKMQIKTFRNRYLKKDVADDDILDSIILSLNAKEIAQGSCIKYPVAEQRNKDGIVMQVLIGSMN